MPKALTIVATFLLMLALLPSCHKKSILPPAKFVGCRIAEIIETPVDTTTEPKTIYHFYYNDDGTVQHIFAFVPGAEYTGSYYYYPGSSYYRYFTYSGSQVFVKTVYASSAIPASLDTLNIDAQNRITSIQNTDLYTAGNTGLNNYLYDNSGNMILHTLYVSQGVQYADSAYWQGGNVVNYVSYVTGNLTDDHFYTYNDTLYNVGNINASLPGLISYGRDVYNSKYLRTQDADTYTDSTYNYTYILDTGGRITNITQTTQGVLFSTTQISYDCE